MGLQDDILYLTLLVASIGLGKVTRNIKDKDRRKVFSTGCGLAILFLVSGLHGFMCLAAFGLQVLLNLVVGWRHLHVVTFFVQFLFLFFFRLSNWVGIPNSPPHTNAIQMMLTLKVTINIRSILQISRTIRSFNS